MIYLWTEDKEGNSGYQFWKTVSKELFSSTIKVESKKNNARLVYAVEKLVNAEDIYIIAFDNAFDNTDVNNLYIRLKNAIKDKENVYLLDMYSFEYILLSFTKLKDWIFKDEEAAKKKELHLKAREALIHVLNGDSRETYKSVQDIKGYFESGIANVGTMEKYTIESFASKLLFNITRNTGFFVDKMIFGDCWKEDCCIDMAESMCGIDIEELTASEKMQILYYNSDLQKILKSVDVLEWEQ